MKKKTPPKPSSSSLPRQRVARVVGGKPIAGTLELLGAELQKRRVNLGLTQKQLAELCGLQVATIGKIESGDPGVKLGTLQAYMSTLNLTLHAVDKDLEGLL